jgi:small subunit ribosomal protein S9
MSPEENPTSGARNEHEEEVQPETPSGAPDAGFPSGQQDAPEQASGTAEEAGPAIDELSPPSAEEEQEPVPAEEAPVPAEAATEPPVEAQEPAGAEVPADGQEAAPAEPPAAEQAPPAQPAPAAEQAPPEAPPEELPEAPRQRPEIPGADLIPDIMPPEQEEFLDAEARAAAEAEAEARAAREREEEEELQAEPIADAAIDLAAGARYSATGKRKSAVARVILKPGSGTYAINGKPLERYFPRDTLQRLIRQPLETVGYDSRMDVVARMHGGGNSAQAGALRHGISRALIVADPHLRGELKRRGYLTRDPRVKERKKAGLKKARKRPQFSKR